MTDKTTTAVRWKAITPSNAAAIEPIPAAVYVGGAGDVVAVGTDGVAATFGATAGGLLQIQPSKILATGTTATGIVALYN